MLTRYRYMNLSSNPIADGLILLDDNFVHTAYTTLAIDEQ